MALAPDLSRIAIGCAPENDVTVDRGLVAPYHPVLHRAGDDTLMGALDDAPSFVDGTACADETVRLTPGAMLSFLQDAAPAMHVEWDPAAELAGFGHYDPMTKLVGLSRVSRLRGLDLTAVARLSRLGEIGRYGMKR